MSCVVYLGKPQKENIVGLADEKGVKPIKGKCEMSEEDIKQVVDFHNIMVNAAMYGMLLTGIIIREEIQGRKRLMKITEMTLTRG